MRIADPILGELDHESVSTRRMLERVPTDKLDWTPHPKSMTLGALAWHLAFIPKRVLGLIAAGSFDLTLAGPGATGVDFLGEFERNMVEIRAAIAELDNDAIRAPFTLMRGDQLINTIPIVAMIRSILLNHSYHHRGQLSVYLRLLDVPLPAIYGTSADERPFA
jgi:uncharacterized damage-inducible protein DinB